MNAVNTSKAFKPRIISALQLALGLLCVYLLSRAALAFIAPESLWDAPPSAPLAASPIAAMQAARLDPRFDAFHRDAAQDVIVEIGTDAPETTLNLKLYGRRAGKDGTAILDGPDKTQKVFGIGDEIMNGVTLKAVNSDHIVLSQGGRIERLTFAREGKNMLTAPDTQTDVIETPITILPESMTADRFMAGVNLAPAIEDGRLKGFRISPKNGTVDLADIGLVSGDIVSAIGGVDLTSPTLNPADIPAQLSGQSQVRLTVLRGNETVFIDLGQ